MKTCSSSASLAWMNPNVFITRAIEIPQTLEFVWNGWIKEMRKGTISTDSSARRHGGRTGVDHASIRNIWLSMEPFVSSLTATWLPFPQNWMNFTKLQIERILEFKFVFSFSGNKPYLQGERERMEKFYSHCCSWPLKIFHLRLKFHPRNLPLSLCLCFDSLSKRCNVFCSEWETGMTACVSTLLINNDQIHHSPVWKMTLQLTRWGKLFQCKHE